MEAMFGQIRQIANTIDGTAKSSLIRDLHALAHSLESVDDTVKRLSHLHEEAAVIRVGIDLKLFDILEARKSPLSLDEIVKTTGGDSRLIGRLMRFLTSVACNRRNCFETSGPMYQMLPEFLKKTNYQTPKDSFHTVFQDAFDFPGSAFEWFGQNPKNLGYYQEYMAGRRQNAQEMWMSLYPIESETKELDPKAPLLVDIGGNIGHNCVHFKTMFPNIPGRIILQDLPENIEAALSTPGVEPVVYNFFEP
ncbi:hypothetical protein EAE96_009514 [Botrytis aclada]|nr:hypothetical protein EAE96_009514 [Botrytis aclada]